MRTRNRSTIQYILRSPITLIISFLLLFILGRASWNVHVSANRANDKLDQYTSELGRLEIQKVEVKSRLEYISTSEGVEAELRSRYRATRPGEMVAVIVTNDIASNISTTTTDVDKSTWQTFLDFFR